jgi:predicted ATPase
MVATLLGESPELDALKRMVIERAEGNPFFLEEVLRALFDDGTLARNGAVRMARPLSQVRLPLTVQAILAARIDRQPDEHKQLLQMLAVIGREAPVVLIRQVVPIPVPRLQRMLAELQGSEFIIEQPALPDAEYAFKHAVTQEVAYGSLLIERRKVLHERAGRALETMFADHVDDHLGELARHYSSSNNVSKGIEFLLRAGQQALQRCAPTDATRYLTEALTLLEKLPDDKERLRRNCRCRWRSDTGLSC